MAGPWWEAHKLPEERALGWTSWRGALALLGLGVCALGVISVVLFAHSKLEQFLVGLVAVVGAWVTFRMCCRVTGADPYAKWKDRRPGPLG